MLSRNKIIVIIFVILSSIYMIFNIITNTSDKSHFIGKSMPSIEIKDSLSNEIIGIDKLKGKVLFINFWATWCRPCIDELPSINSLYGRLKNEKDFKMVTIIFKENEQTALQYLKNNNIDFPVFSDPSGKTAIIFDVQKVPETYIVNKKGIVTRAVQGAENWSSPEVIDHLLYLINE